jgi:uncharacterized protein YdeI (BOF family)
MKTTIKTLSVLILAGTFAFTACKKKDDAAPETPNTTTGGTTGGSASSAPVTPHLGDADGVMIASKANVITSVGGFSVSITVGSAIANVYSSTGGTSAVDGGTIKANDSTLAKQSNNSYVFTPKSAQGIGYGSSSAWSISGNSSNNVPAVSYTATNFPSAPTVNNTTTVSKGSAFTMTTTSISNADSLCFQITSGSKTIYKMTNGFQTSYTFPSSDMGTLDNSSNAYLTITAYKFKNTTVSGKKYYFINMNTTNRMVSVTN